MNHEDERPIEEVAAELDAPAPEALDVQVGRTWSEEQWQGLVATLVEHGLAKWSEIATVTLGELNPPQVGTSLASNPNIKAQYQPRKAWQAVREWLYSQPLGCRECGTLLKLEAEHVIPKDEIGAKADELVNVQLLCKRCNTKKRPSHKKAGLTHLTAEAGLMWLLFVFRPATYQEFEKLCRDYGMTMANIRFQEAWAMAEWLAAAGRYP
jgi:5-methylcytosine-specific restriction endonuclease McrA